MPPTHYEHTQPAHLIRVAMGLSIAAILITAAVVPHVEEQTWLRQVAIGSLVVLFVLVTALFWSLTVTVTGEYLAWHFGLGVIRKRVPLTEIESCEPTRTSFWNGWGIHWSPRGWVYNVSGYGAVEVRLKSGKAFRLGTDEPEALAEAVRNALGQ